MFLMVASLVKWEEVERSADHSNQEKDIFEDKVNQEKDDLEEQVSRKSCKEVKTTFKTKNKLIGCTDSVQSVQADSTKVQQQ